MSSYQGKKVMFIIAPLQSSDSNMIQQFRVFHDRFGDSVQIIGVMSIEDGFSSANSATIKALYDSNGINIPIVLTSGMYTKKSSGASQSPLMKWLTEIDLNDVYDVESKGIGDKYFINKLGKLYGLSFPDNSLLSANVSWILFRDN